MRWSHRATLSRNNDLLIEKNKDLWHTLSCPLVMSSHERIFFSHNVSTAVSCLHFMEYCLRFRSITDILCQICAFWMPTFEGTAFWNPTFYFSRLSKAMLHSISGCFNQDWLMSFIRQLSHDVPKEGCAGLAMAARGTGLVWAEPAGSAGQFLLAADLSLLSVHRRWDPGQLEKPLRQMSNIFFYWSR